MGILNNEFRENLTGLFIYFIEKNVKGMINQLSYMDILPDDFDRRALKYDFMDI